MLTLLIQLYRSGCMLIGLLRDLQYCFALQNSWQIICCLYLLKTKKTKKPNNNNAKKSVIFPIPQFPSHACPCWAIENYPSLLYCKKENNHTNQSLFKKPWLHVKRNHYLQALACGFFLALSICANIDFMTARFLVWQVSACTQINVLYHHLVCILEQLWWGHSVGV